MSANADAARPAPLAVLAFAAQLLGVWTAIHALEIGGPATSRVTALACGGALLRLALPLRWRLPSFVALCAAGIALVLGPQGGWVVAVGMVILGLLHLPAPLPLRAALLLALGLVLAAMRRGVWPAPWSPALWPVLGSLFLLRTLASLHELRQGPARGGPANALAYLFMLPNLGQTLFPVVDCQRFGAARTDRTDLPLAQRGLAWMVRGALHIALYRAVYLHATLAPADVAGPLDLARQVVAGYALYLRLSGTFHLAIGMLLLHGWDLPPTHDRYFLACGISDMWRRMNIYWKDAMMKWVFVPAFFRWKRWGQRPALLLASLQVIAATWLLHELQWFWTEGRLLLRWQDALFWSVLGVLMGQAGLRELARRPKPPAHSLRAGVAHALGVAATFIGMATLWSMWTSDSFAEWTALWSVLGRGWLDPAWQWLLAPASLAAAFALLAIPQAPARQMAPPRPESPAAAPLGLAALLLLAWPAAWEPLGARAAAFAESLRGFRLNAIDAGRLQRGYYEDLLNASAAYARLWEQQDAPAREPWIGHTAAARDTGDYRRKELAPFASMVFRGRPFHTNAWGLRDGDYARAKPARTYRIALLGASTEMGASLGDGEAFEQRVEERLARELGPRTGWRYEILNFSMGAYSPIQRLMMLEARALAFDPDAVLYVAHAEDFDFEAWALEHAYAADGPLPPHPELRAILDRAGLFPGISRAELERRLAPRAGELDAAVMSLIARRCAARGIRALWTWLPSVGPLRPRVALRARPPQGFVALELAGVFDGVDEPLAIGGLDFHHNARAHQLIADRLFDELRRVGLPEETR